MVFGKNSGLANDTFTQMKIQIEVAERIDWTTDFLSMQ